MTKIGKRIIVRETAALYRGDPLVIQPLQRSLRIHPKGKAAAYVYVPYPMIYELGLKLAARHVERSHDPD